MAFEGQDEFFVAKLLVPAGTEVAVGDPILLSVEDESFISAFDSYQLSKKPETTLTSPVAPNPVPTPVPVPVSVSINAKPATPEVKPVTSVSSTTPVSTLSVPKSTPSTPASITQPTSGVYSGFYSQRGKDAISNHSPLSSKLKSDQEQYMIKYGRAIPSVLEHKKPSK
jgi:pyruvate dehydrogenase E2 component (dihydrolipoamide acetyltransferase)